MSEIDWATRRAQFDERVKSGAYGHSEEPTVTKIGTFDIGGFRGTESYI
jgi:hypothetical protein